jgi:hypothetical protein
MVKRWFSARELGKIMRRSERLRSRKGQGLSFLERNPAARAQDA